MTQIHVTDNIQPRVLSPEELARLNFWQNLDRSGALQLYREIREAASDTDISGLPSAQNRRKLRKNLTWLETRQFLRSEKKSRLEVWTVLPVPAKPSRHSFRGYSVLSIVNPPGPVSPEEMRALFIHFRHDVNAAAVYLDIRKRQSVTIQSIASHIGISDDTVRTKMARLISLQLIEVNYTEGYIRALPVEEVGEEEVDEEAFYIWVNDPALIQPPTAELTRLASSKRQSDKIELFFRFYDDLAELRSRRRRSIPLAQIGRRGFNRIIAKRLLERYEFHQIMGPLTFFMIDWRGEPLDEYGYSLANFERNLDAITLEWEENGGKKDTWSTLGPLRETWGKFLKYDPEKLNNLRKNRIREWNRNSESGQLFLEECRKDYRFAKLSWELESYREDFPELEEIMAEWQRKIDAGEFTPPESTDDAETDA